MVKLGPKRTLDFVELEGGGGEESWLGWRWERRDCPQFWAGWTWVLRLKWGGGWLIGVAVSFGVGRCEEIEDGIGLGGD